MQQSLPHQYPKILDADDLTIMGKAFDLALSQTDCAFTRENPEALGRTVISLYRLGLVDPDKLAPIAMMLTASKLFRNCRDIAA